MPSRRAAASRATTPSASCTARSAGTRGPSLPRRRSRARERRRRTRCGGSRRLASGGTISPTARASCRLRETIGEP
eukprot:575641-Prymnesium_polylepis.1